MKSSFLAVALICVGSVAAAQTDTSGAKSALFPAKSAALAVSQSLSSNDQATMKALMPLMQERLAVSVGYYGAFAYSAADGLVSESLQGAFNYHSIAAAEQAALRACEAAKTGGRCSIAARILPKGYSDRAFTLSQPATQSALGDYARAGGGKAFATSASTGAFGWGAGDAAAIATCGQQGAGDCRVVIRD